MRPVCVVVLSVVVAIAAVVSYTGGSEQADAVVTMKHKVGIEFIEPGDLDGIQDWAERWCLGESVSSLASSLGAEPTVDAVASALAGSLPVEAHQVIRQTCARVLAD